MSPPKLSWVENKAKLKVNDRGFLHAIHIVANKAKLKKKEVMRIVGLGLLLFEKGIWVGFVLFAPS